MIQPGFISIEVDASLLSADDISTTRTPCWRQGMLDPFPLQRTSWTTSRNAPLALMISELSIVGQTAVKLVHHTREF